MESVRNRIINLFRAKRIRMSYHRYKIAEYLATHRNHPTAEMVYEALYREIPTLSKTTVYNVLKLFSEKGIVQELHIDQRGVRYDFNVRPHAHFKCIICGQVYDLEDVDFHSVIKSEIKGHQVFSVELNYIGICRTCLVERGEAKDDEERA